VKKAAAILLIVGLMQMSGDLLGISALKGIGAATGASPAPKVFSSVRGLETFSSRFFIEWIDPSGARSSVRLTPELYARLRGPYNRRNVYGAAIAYGPVMPAALRDPVMRFALCGDMPLLREVGIDPRRVAAGLKVRVEPLAGTKAEGRSLILEPPCPP
jgi:hypothetical protein